MSTATDTTDTFKVAGVGPDQPQAKHFDDGKPKIQWLPYEALAWIADAFEYGAGKYGTLNYQSGMPWSKLMGSCFRHGYKFMMGEDIDEESGLHHLKLMGADVCMLIYTVIHHQQLDDRKATLK